MLALTDSRQRGDTLIEVLVAIAVVSTVLVTAYMATRRSLNVVQDTQEHAQALQIVQAQVEFLHNAKLGSDDTCFTNAGTPAVDNGKSFNNPCLVNATGSMITKPGAEPAYKLAITGATVPCKCAVSYTVSATWESLLQGQPNNVTLYYQQ